MAYLLGYCTSPTILWIWHILQLSNQQNKHLQLMRTHLSNNMKDHPLPALQSTLEPRVEQTCPKWGEKNQFLFNAAFYCYTSSWIANHHSNTVTYPTSSTYSTINLQSRSIVAWFSNKWSPYRLGSMPEPEATNNYERAIAPEPRQITTTGSIPPSNAANFSLRTTDDGSGTKA